MYKGHYSKTIKAKLSSTSF